jgi:hypothetical protein
VALRSQTLCDRRWRSPTYLLNIAKRSLPESIFSGVGDHQGWRKERARDEIPKSGVTCPRAAMTLSGGLARHTIGAMTNLVTKIKLVLRPCMSPSG